MTVMMSSQLSIRGSIVFLLLLPLVSSQCSTCLDGKCHDDGECITGCVPGYVDRYCDDKCPTNCINSVCHVSHSGTVTCSEGCKPGYCGAKCSVPCPSDCETCGRSCVNCNVTLCPQGRYGDNCESTCDLKFEKCDSESGNCVKCKRGYYGDECGKTCPSSCLSSKKVLLSRCVSQCQSCSSGEFCPPGVYGMSCDKNCSRNCGRPDSSEQRPCNKATGECSAGCQSGYYGRTCNYTCSELCLSGICSQSTGECSAGCKPGYYGRTCNYTCSELCLSGICNQSTGECSEGCQSGFYGLTCSYTCSELCLSDTCYQHNGTCEYGCIAGYTISNGICNKHSHRVPWVVIVTIICGLVILIIIVIIGIICCMRRKIKRSKTSQDQEEMVHLNDSALEQSIFECRKLQEKAAQELKEVADRLREQQRNMNKAKVAFGWGELSAGGMAAAGVLLAPFTAGVSIALTVAGAGVGIAAASGNVASVVTEFKTIGNRVEEAKRILEELEKETNGFLDILKTKVETAGIDWSSFIDQAGTNMKYKGLKVFGHAKLLKNAMNIVDVTFSAKQIIISLSSKQAAKAGTKNVAKMLPAAMGKVAKVTTVGLIGVSMALDLNNIIVNTSKIRNNVSEVADKIEEVANALLGTKHD